MKRLSDLLLSYLIAPSLVVLAVAYSASVRADFIADVSLLSDYRFNGVSYSNRGPVLQAGIAYQDESGVYAGTWGSNVDFGAGDPAKYEWDFFAGYVTALNGDVNLDLGVSYFSYLGSSGASDGNYPELYAGLQIETNTELYLYYSPNYFGADTGHYIFRISQAIPLGDYVYGFAFAHNQAQDKEKYAWGDDKASYQYIEVSAAREWQGFDLSATAMISTIRDGDYKDTAKPTLVVGITRAFSL